MVFLHSWTYDLVGCQQESSPKPENGAIWDFVGKFSVESSSVCIFASIWNLQKTTLSWFVFCWVFFPQGKLINHRLGFLV